MPSDRARGRPGSFVRNLRIGTKLSATVAVAVLALIGLTLVGVASLRAAGRDNGSLLVSERAGRAALEADMMHDAVRADVLQAMLFSGAEYNASLRDLNEHSAALRASLAEVTRVELARGVTVAAEGVAPAVEEYLRSAQQIAVQAGADTTGARTAYPMFLAAFEQLEVELPSVGDALTEHASSVAGGTTSRRASATWLLAGTGLAGGLVLAAFGSLVSRSVAGPMHKTVTVLEGLAEGRLDLHVDVDTTDEVGQMAAALNRAMARLREAIGAMGTNALGLASSSAELSAVSAQMSGSAQESASQAQSVSAAAEQVSMNVQTVAAGTEQMSASIREIAKNTTDASGVAQRAVQVAESARATVAKLGESSAEIGTVIKVINSIAEQTNLLALNATIEAARAGEAGKGFAVVASEVKELARETSKATEDIGHRIDAIQLDTTAAVAAIAEISAIVERINETQATIASAVEEQTATTNEMSRSVSEASTGSTEIASTITGVATTAAETTSAAGSTSRAADELARRAADMQQLVGQFRC